VRTSCLFSVGPLEALFSCHCSDHADVEAHASGDGVALWTMKELHLEASAYATPSAAVSVPSPVVVDVCLAESLPAAMELEPPAFVLPPARQPSKFYVDEPCATVKPVAAFTSRIRLHAATGLVHRHTAAALGIDNAVARVLGRSSIASEGPLSFEDEVLLVLATLLGAFRCMQACIL
jgi:hypothetical protein